MECVNAAGIVLLHNGQMHPDSIAGLAQGEGLASDAINQRWREPYQRLYEHSEFELRQAGLYALSDFGERKARFLVGVLAVMRYAETPIAAADVTFQVLQMLNISGDPEWFDNLKNERLFSAKGAGYALTENGKSIANLVMQWFPDICSQLQLSSQVAIKAYGTRWQRRGVDWKGKSTKLYGKLPNRSAKEIDYNGIYALYRKDVSVPVYVGQTTRRLAERLDEHTRNDKKDIWDEFSWFGITPIDKSALYYNAGAQFNQFDMINALESILITVIPCLCNDAPGVLLGERFEQYPSGAIV